MGKEKPLIHKTKKCGGTYDVLYTETNIPYLRCDNCDHELKDWVKWEEEYSEYWSDDSKWGEKKHHITCLLGFFAVHFKNHYGFNYSFSLNEKGLFRGPEQNILRRVYNSFNGDPYLVRKYMDWYFDLKIKRRKKRITNLSFLATPEMMNEFKIHYKRTRQISRDKKLPIGMTLWINDFTPSLKAFEMHDYGDLRHMLEMYKAGNTGESTDDVTKLVQELKRQGVVTEKCQIRNWRE